MSEKTTVGPTPFDADAPASESEANDRVHALEGFDTTDEVAALEDLDGDTDSQPALDALEPDVSLNEVESTMVSVPVQALELDQETEASDADSFPEPELPLAAGASSKPEPTVVQNLAFDLGLAPANPDRTVVQNPASDLSLSPNSTRVNSTRVDRAPRSPEAPERAPKAPETPSRAPIAAETPRQAPIAAETPERAPIAAEPPERTMVSHRFMVGLHTSSAEAESNPKAHEAPQRAESVADQPPDSKGSESLTDRPSVRLDARRPAPAPRDLEDRRPTKPNHNLGARGRGASTGRAQRLSGPLPRPVDEIQRLPDEIVMADEEPTTPAPAPGGIANAERSQSTEGDEVSSNPVASPVSPDLRWFMAGLVSLMFACILWVVWGSTPVDRPRLLGHGSAGLAKPRTPRSWVDAFRQEHPQAKLPKSIPFVPTSPEKPVRFAPVARTTVRDRPLAAPKAWPERRYEPAQLPKYKGRPQRDVARPPYVAVSSKPNGAKVTVGNRTVGRTPLLRNLGRNDELGNQSVTLTLDGYQPLVGTLLEDPAGPPGSLKFRGKLVPLKQ